MCHRRHRSLTVRAGDVQRAECALRMAERLAESRDVLEAQLDAEVLEREETIESGVQEVKVACDLCPVPGELCGFTTDAGERWRRLGWCCGGRAHEPERAGDCRLQVAPIDDEIEHPVFKQELASLEALR